MALLGRLPRGAWLSPAAWRTRHALNTRLLWMHVPALMLLGVLGPRPLAEALGLPLVPVGLALLVRVVRSQRARSELASLALVSTSLAAIELSGGWADTHLHLCAIMIFIAFYHQWTALAWAVLVTVAHHVGLGLLAPARVFGTSRLTTAEVLGTAAVHSCLLLLVVIGILIWWHFTEVAEAELQQLATESEQAAIEAEDQRAQAAAREAATEQAAQERRNEVAARLVRDATLIRDGAQEAISAVGTVETQVEMLSTAVSDIAHRSHQAAGTATNGQSTAELAAGEVRRLERAMGEIADVNAMIAQLAGQTNLLSLNATIEAARAGEMGKGFAVVASEVKALANETADSSAKVSSAIEGVVSETEAVARSFASTSAVVGEIHSLQVDIAASVEQQAATLAEVSRQLAAATAAARSILTGLDELTQTAATL